MNLCRNLIASSLDLFLVRFLMPLDSDSLYFANSLETFSRNNVITILTQFSLFVSYVSNVLPKKSQIKSRLKNLYDLKPNKNTNSKQFTRLSSPHNKELNAPL
jgi:hypothetical protein